ncbi:MAG: HAD-IIB family hydrolase [Phycisphaerae bacterium]
MELPYRLLALDVDGTLVNSRNELSEANRAALHRAHQAGLKITLCTGRSLIETAAVLDALGLDLDAGIFVFGAIITDLATRSTLIRSAFSEELAARVAAHFRSRGHPLLVLYDSTQTGIDYQLVAGEKNLSAYEAFLRMSPARAERLADWKPLPFPPVRIGVIVSPEQIERTVADLRAEFPPERLRFNAIYAPNYRVHVVECFPPRVNKWQALVRLADRMGIPPSRVAALGDDVNDVEMIARAGLGVAMGNAVESVREVARLRVASHDEDGVADLVDRLLAGDVPPPREEGAASPDGLK